MALPTPAQITIFPAEAGPDPAAFAPRFKWVRSPAAISADASVKYIAPGIPVASMPKGVVRCAECNCHPAICLAAETARDCRGCSQVSNVSAECCCWQAAHGLA